MDRSKKVIVIVNKSVQHPKAPARPGNHRVNEFWSFMVIKPTTSAFNKPGVSFILTYFDNPGLSIPKYITNWVAKKQMPDFLGQLHQATLNYASMKKQNETRIVSLALVLLSKTSATRVSIQSGCLLGQTSRSGLRVPAGHPVGIQQRGFSAGAERERRFLKSTRR